MDLEKQIARDLAKKAMEDIRAQLDRAYELSKMGPSGTYRELHIQLLTQLFDFTISGMVRTTTVSAPLFLGMTRQLYEFHAARRQEHVKGRLERKSLRQERVKERLERKSLRQERVKERLERKSSEEAS